MLDIKFVREKTDEVRKALKKRGYDLSLDEFLGAEEARRVLMRQAEELRARRNSVSDEIGRLKKGGGDAGEKISEMKGVSDEIKALDEKLRAVAELLADEPTDDPGASQKDDNYTGEYSSHSPDTGPGY